MEGEHRIFLKCEMKMVLIVEKQSSASPIKCKLKQQGYDIFYPLNWKIFENVLTLIIVMEMAKKYTLSYKLDDNTNCYELPGGQFGNSYQEPLKCTNL